MKAKCKILPPAQKLVWPRLKEIPDCFILYGGTAVALQYAHRESVDFDFFTHLDFSVASLVDAIPLLQTEEIQVLQNAKNNYTVLLMRPEGPVKLSFFGGIKNGLIEAPLRANDNGIYIASPLDLSAHKLKVVQQRVELKDYQDIAVLLANGISLELALSASDALFPHSSNIAIMLKTITYFDDERLSLLSDKEKKQIVNKAVKVSDIPSVSLLKAEDLVGHSI